MPEARLEDEEKPWQTDQKSRATLSSRADLCLVSEEIPSLGGFDARGLGEGIAQDLTKRTVSLGQAVKPDFDSCKYI